MPLQIFLVNVYSMLNAGDAALTIETIQQLKDNFPGCQITMSIDDSNTQLSGVKIVESINTWVRSPWMTGRSAWNLRNLFLLPWVTLLPILTHRLFGKPFFIFTPARIRPAIRPYLEANLVISKPGGFLYTSGSGLSFLMIIYTLSLVWIAGKPLYFYPQSFGPLTRRWEERLLRWILGKARLVMVREPVSMELLHKYNIHHPRMLLLPDTAFAFPAASPKMAQNWLRKNGLDPASNHPLLGLTVLNWSASDTKFNRQAEYETACVEAIRFFIEKLGGYAILFPHVTGPNSASDDRIPSRRILAQLREIASSILYVDQQIPPDLLKAIYGRLDVLIGTRMHSNIFALSETVPVIAIGYFHKTRGIASMLGMDRWVLDIQTITRESLVNKLIELWEERHVVREQIAGILPTLVEQSKCAGKLCAEDFKLLSEKKQNG